MSVDVSVDELTWNGAEIPSKDTLSDTVQVDMSGGDGQYLFLFQKSTTADFTIEAQAGDEFWMEDQGNSSYVYGSADSDVVVMGPFEGGRFKDGSDNKITFTVTAGASLTGSISAADSWMHALKVPKG